MIEIRRGCGKANRLLAVQMLHLLRIGGNRRRRADHLDPPVAAGQMLDKICQQGLIMCIVCAKRFPNEVKLVLNHQRRCRILHGYFTIV